ncbi:hypothetical protein BZF66_05695 [Salmonella enterica]|uniref:hypothetical protein n=1 Tax=Salmonella enterica TaxID=28901 RepID=UPI000FDF8E93|nr:hypothetical protein CPT_Munch_519 [Salmonella phage Munch]EAZ2022785.1 hypothetical protein [Salmonella enterica]ECV9083919.1 hypothetical protein [Salmonella enterica subsp. enterica serovar Infantis]MCP0435482.1 hypothetical protein [Salmonella enterica subsp. enterica serovar Mbandaka]ECC6867455.1 hypothetical protein [Salmonella enterica]
MIKEFPDGVSVRELKELIKDWPEVRENGEDTMVYLGDGNGYSNQAIEVSTIDQDEHGVSDLFIAHNSK